MKLTAGSLGCAVDPYVMSTSQESELKGIRYNIDGIRAFLHFSFCVKLKIETQNTFKPPNTAQTSFIYHIILYNQQYSL